MSSFEQQCPHGNTAASCLECNLTPEMDTADMKTETVDLSGRQRYFANILREPHYEGVSGFPRYVRALSTIGEYNNLRDSGLRVRNVSGAIEGDPLDAVLTGSATMTETHNFIRNHLRNALRSVPSSGSFEDGDERKVTLQQWDQKKEEMQDILGKEEIMLQELYDVYKKRADTVGELSAFKNSTGVVRGEYMQQRDEIYKTTVDELKRILKNLAKGMEPDWEV